MTPERRHGLRRAYRASGIAIAICLIAIECFDAMVTPRPDWLWFGAAIGLLILCRPRKRDSGGSMP